MSTPSYALLPVGLRDYLPDEARLRTRTARTIRMAFEANGYDVVIPPLLEFEPGLYASLGQPLPDATFRVTDRASTQMLAVRNDMTPQIARLATTRLQAAPRPLRLCYQGDILRSTVDAMQPDRQVLQVGCELVGSTSLAADAEVIRLAVHALATAGLEGISVDLCLPSLPRSLLKDAALNPDQCQAIIHALHMKDTAALPKTLPADQQKLWQTLLQAFGTPDSVFSAIKALVLPAPVLALLQQLADLADNLSFDSSIHSVTVDLSEQQRFSYQDGICFSIFAKGYRGEIARGGRYTIAESHETAVGFSVAIEPLLRLLNPILPLPVLLVPASLSLAARQSYQEQGWRTITHLDTSPLETAAEKHQCQAWLDGTTIRKITV